MKLATLLFCITSISLPVIAMHSRKRPLPEESAGHTLKTPRAGQQTSMLVDQNQRIWTSSSFAQEYIFKTRAQMQKNTCGQ